MSWIYKDEVINTLEEIPQNAIGFVYEITQLTTGRKYIGKKSLYTHRTLPPLKGEKKKRKIIKESDWQKYYGSQTDLKQLVKANTQDFYREILEFAYTKKTLTYLENKFLFTRGVIEPGSNYFNSNIESRYFRKDFHETDKNITGDE
jgi:hypothetical protein